MKTHAFIALLAVFLFAPLTGSAQVFLSGTAQFGIQKYSSTQTYPGLPSFQYNTKSTSFAIHPRVGYFIGEKWVAGLELGAQWTNTENTIAGSETTLFQFGAFGRYFFKTFDRVRFFADANALYGTGSTENYQYAVTERAATTQLYGSLRPGISVSLSPKVNVEASFGAIEFTQFSTKYTNETRTSDDFNVDFNSIRLGVWFKL